MKRESLQPIFQTEEDILKNQDFCKLWLVKGSVVIDSDLFALVLEC